MNKIKLNELTLLKDNPRKISKANFEKLKRDIESDKDFLEKDNYWHVLVWFGHGDDAATRKEVKGTLLLIHG